MENFKKFQDLSFEFFSDIYLHGKRARMLFPNGYGVSVISHNYSYGGKDGLYEIGVLDTAGDLCYDTPVTNDVIGWLSEDDVSRVMREVQELPSAS